jgi:hypothetical protein
MDIACTLTGKNQKTQRDRWVTLAERFGIARHETRDGLHLTFEDSPGVAAELQALVEVENGCCAWATWIVERDADGALVMTARSQGQGIATLHSMFKM